MNVDRADHLHVLIQRTNATRKEYDDRDPSRKKMMKDFLKKKKATADVTFGMGLALHAHWKRLHKTMGQIRPPVWFAVTECPECGFMESISSKSHSKESMFVCSTCKSLTSAVWIEERGKDRVDELEIKARYMYEANLIEAAKVGDAWTNRVKAMHLKLVKKEGCKVQQNTVNRRCEWCEEIAS